LEGLNRMSTAMISVEAVWAGHTKARENWALSELLKLFGRRVFSIAKHITQNDGDAEDVLIETFLEVCSDWDGCEEDEEFWVRLLTIAVKKAFLRPHRWGEGGPRLDEVVESCEDVVIRELSVWGNSNQQHDPREPASILEHGMRSLDPMCRAVFVLHDIEEISVELVAEILSRSVPAVKVCLLRARLQLRDVLTSELMR
jgi:RNA polymerase sigma-70 factor, ECF subfamily